MKKRLIVPLSLLLMAQYIQAESTAGSWWEQIKEAYQKAQRQTQDTRPAETSRQPQRPGGWLERLNDMLTGQTTTPESERTSQEQQELERQRTYDREHAREKLSSGWEQLKAWGRQVFGGQETYK